MWDLTIHLFGTQRSCWLAMHALEGACMFLPLLSQGGISQSTPWNQRPHWLVMHALEGHVCSFPSSAQVGSHDLPLGASVPLASHACLGGTCMFVPLSNRYGSHNPSLRDPAFLLASHTYPLFPSPTNMDLTIHLLGTQRSCWLAIHAPCSPLQPTWISQSIS